MKILLVAEIMHQQEQGLWQCEISVLGCTKGKKNFQETLLKILALVYWA